MPPFFYPFTPMIFRQATLADLPRILTILDAAIRRLGALGIDQWQHGYPNRQRIEEDLREGLGYVLEAEEVVAYGAVIFTGEEAYKSIEGEWLTSTDDYVVVHRLCVADEAVGRGYGRAFMEHTIHLAQGRTTSFRVDTHADNHTMQRLLTTLGFQRCGIIYIESHRLVAFERLF